MQGLNNAFGMVSSRRRCVELTVPSAEVQSLPPSSKTAPAPRCSASNRWRNTEPSWTASTRSFTSALQEKWKSECQKAARGFLEQAPSGHLILPISNYEAANAFLRGQSRAARHLLVEEKNSRMRDPSMTVTRLRRGLRAAVALATMPPWQRQVWQNE